MPYKDAKSVNQYSECANLTYVDVNNAAQQLLDNDLYIEAQLNNVSSYAVGPKTTSNVYSAPNGYKVYSGLETA